MAASAHRTPSPPAPGQTSPSAAKSQTSPPEGVHNDPRCLPSLRHPASVPSATKTPNAASWRSSSYGESSSRAPRGSPHARNATPQATGEAPTRGAITVGSAPCTHTAYSTYRRFAHAATAKYVETHQRPRPLQASPSHAPPAATRPPAAPRRRLRSPTAKTATKRTTRANGASVWTVAACATHTSHKNQCPQSTLKLELN